MSERKKFIEWIIILIVYVKPSKIPFRINQILSIHVISEYLWFFKQRIIFRIYEQVYARS